MFKTPTIRGRKNLRTHSRSFHRTHARPRVELLEDRCLLSYTLNEFAIPTPNSRPDTIQAGPDGNVYFIESSTNTLGRITPAGQITEVPMPVADGDVPFLFGPDGNIWFGGYADIGEMTPQGVLLHDYQIPSATPNFAHLGVHLGPDGNIWYTEPYKNNDVVGKITPAGQITEYLLPFGDGGPMVNGPDGNLWVAGNATMTLARIPLDGTLLPGQTIPTSDTFNLPSVPGENGVRGLTVGPDGNFWMTTPDPVQPVIFRVNTSGQVTGEFNVPTLNSFPYAMTVGSDGALWFTENRVDQIGRISTDGTITEIPIPTGNSISNSIASGPDGNIWFSEYYPNNIGKLILNPHTSTSLVSSANPSVVGQQVTFTATVSTGPAAGEPVTFMDGYTTLGTATLNSADQATFTTSTLAVGSHTITAVYGGDSFFLASSASLTQTVNRDFTTTTLTVTPAAAPKIIEYSMPTPNSGPDWFAADPDGNVWLSETNNHSLARITPTGQITEIPIPTSLQGGQLAFDPDGNIWIGGHTDIGEITPQGVLLHDYTIQSALSTPFSWNTMAIAFGNDGNIWYTNGYVNNLVGRLNPADGTSTEFSLGFGGQNIINGPDGNIWVGGNGMGTLARVHLDGTIDTFQLPQPFGGPRGLTVGPDRNLWMTDANQILRVNTAGQLIGQFAIPTANSGAYGMAVGSDGALWFGEINANQIGRITVDGVITELPVPTPNSGCGVVVRGSDGNIWFGEEYANQIGEVVLNHGVSTYGQQVTLTATVSAPLSQPGTPTGSVTFYNGNAILGSVALPSGGPDQVSLTTTALPVGTDSISAVYSGDSNFVGSSGSLTQTVSQDQTVTAVTASPADPSVLNQSVSFTATISATAPGSGTPTGTVQFQIDNVNFGNPVPLTTAGTATSGPTAALAASTHTITAIYSGDGSFLASTGNLTQTVYTAQQQNNAIVTQVNNLVTTGVLNSGNGNALTTKLNSATTSLNASPPNNTAAVNQLNAFINQVNAFLKSGKLTSAQAQSLISAANLAISAIQGTGTKLQDAAAAASITTNTQPVTDAGQLVTGELDVYLVNADGSAASADEQARFDDAVTALDTTFGPNGVDLVDVGVAGAANAVVQVQIAGTSAAGCAADGVLGCTVAGNITLLTGWSWFTGADPTTIGSSQYDFETIVMHELGHAIGLGHSGDTNSVMYAYLAPGQTSRAVTSADLSVLDSPSTTPEPLLAAPWRDASRVTETGIGTPALVRRIENPSNEDDGRDLVFAFAGTVVDGLPAATGSETRAELGGGVGDPRRTQPIDAVFAGANQSPIFAAASQRDSQDAQFEVLLYPSPDGFDSAEENRGLHRGRVRVHRVA
jgi:streptogramin lyase